MELSLSLQAGRQGAVEAAMLAHQGWQQGCLPCGDVHCIRGCPLHAWLPICGAASDQAGRGPETFLVEDTLPSATGGGEGSVEIKCFS